MHGVDWTRLPLARATVDRAAHRRGDPDLFGAARSDPLTGVLLVADGRLATTGTDLALVTPEAADALAARQDGDEPLVLFLGEEAGRSFIAYVLADVPGDQVDISGVPVGADLTWATLREVGHSLADRDAGLAAAAVGLAAWHERHPRCPRCGSPTVPAQGGWTRRCGTDGSDHYPRTDPAVIMAVVDPDERLLLGHAAHWPERRFSTLAGFVEPGESAEAAVRREVLEETAVLIGDVEYRGSQPWPFPASLMLAYVARATSTEVTVDGLEMTDARWFARQGLADAVGSGEVLLPMRTSVSRALIEEWFGGPL